MLGINFYNSLYSSYVLLKKNLLDKTLEAFKVFSVHHTIVAQTQQSILICEEK